MIEGGHERIPLMQCAVCGTENLPTARFCDRCGSALQAQTPATGATVSLGRDSRAAASHPAPHARVYDVADESSPAPPLAAPVPPAAPLRGPGGQPYVPTFGPSSYAPAAGAGTVAQQSSAALFSLILGVVAMTLFVLLLCTVLLSPFTIVLGIAAVFFGRRAQHEIAASRGQLSGIGMARAGMILGWINIALSILGFIALCAIPVLTALGSQV
jgi:hypothetical protein